MDAYDSVERDAASSVTRIQPSRNGSGESSSSTPHGIATTRTVAHLQRLAGNAATAQRFAVQRVPTAAERLTALEKADKVQKKKSDAVGLDLQYRADFGAVIAGYEQIIYRLGGGFQGGLSAFTQTNTDQAQSDAVRAQLIGAIITVGAAAAFEPFLMPFLGKLSSKLAGAQEAIENPFNALVSGAVNAAATAAGNAAVQKGQPPTSTAPAGNGSPAGVTASGDPLSFQSQNLEALASKRAGIEAAFGLRASKSNSWTDDQWLGFDRAEQEKIYVAKMTDLKQFPTVDKLKTLGDISLIIEKFLWAQWVQQNAFSTPFMSDTKGQKSLNLTLGGNRESKFKQLGIDRAAGVTFRWYGNAPQDWQQKILDWAGSFNERLGS